MSGRLRNGGVDGHYSFPCYKGETTANFFPVVFGTSAAKVLGPYCCGFYCGRGLGNMLAYAYISRSGARFASVVVTKFGLIPGFRNTLRVCSEFSSRDSRIDIRGGRHQLVMIPTIRSLRCYSAEMVPNRNLIIAGLMNTNGRKFKVRFMRGFPIASKAFLVLDAVCMIGAGLRTERGASKPR